MKTFKFKGIKNGDHESFCFDVDKEDFINITGKKPNKYDKSFFNKGKYRIYPNDLLKDIIDDVEHDFEFAIGVSK
ncbi:hypothetical protein BC351_01075 [Paenibacillus ferrarius]|uniref:Uncharacterized protein n=1 Tax=Paenibacillus ferrarius TaxID=1469647 RepID=A0A1V4HSE3_9BACL|nr:hypothetical protein [Paenibacillus ferrarius]OPH61864.1 hypothetical protein BC351_01075 [Paenibacillus ferrarius]